MNLRRTVSLLAAAVWQVPDAVRATKPAEPWRVPRKADPSGSPLPIRTVPVVAREPWCRWCLGPCSCRQVEVVDGDWAYVTEAGGDAA